MVRIPLPKFVSPLSVCLLVEAFGQEKIAGRESGIGTVPKTIVRVDTIIACLVHCRVEEYTHAEIVLTECADFTLFEFHGQYSVFGRYQVDDAAARSRPFVADDGFDAVVLVFRNLQKLLQMQTSHVGVAHNRKIARDRAAFHVEFLV